ncbi:MAG: transglycosylase SLT domain-containing protein [Longimicrobiales bacterium]
MRTRYLALALLFLAAVAAPLLLRHDDARTAAQMAGPAPVPEEALEALEQGRYWRASRILRQYLAVTPDTAPETILLAAQAEAGWGGWPRVESLLEGVDWLDRAAGGSGWELLARSRFEQGEWTESEAAYRRYLEVAVDAGDRERGLVQAGQARALRQAERYAEAVAAFERAATSLPQIADWLAIFAAEAAAAAGDTTTVEANLTSVDADLAREWAWRLRATTYRSLGAYDRALRIATAAASELDAASDRAAAWELVGRIRLERGDTAGAGDAFRRAMAASASGSAAIDAARQLTELPGLTAADRLRIGRVYLRNGNRERGIAGLTAYLESGSGSEAERREIRFDVAEAYFELGDYDEAVSRLLRLEADSPGARLGSEALYLTGRAQYRQGKVDEALATLRRTADRYPGQPAATQALYLIADLRHDAGDVETARTFYRRAIESDVDSYEAGLSMMRLASMAIVDDRPRDALEIFERYRARYPNGRRYEQATYWAAKMYDRLGETQLARGRMRAVWEAAPIGYYGVRAADHLGGSLTDLVLEPSPPAAAGLEDEVARALLRLDLLREIGRDDAVAKEIDRLREHFEDRDGALYRAAEALNERGFTFDGISLGWRIHEREGAWNLRLLRIIYPFPYHDAILAEAEERGLDPWLVAGLIRQESMFDADIRSRAGAIGLMQIMPQTGRGLARAAGIAAFDESILEQPEINVHLGTAYLQEMLDRYDGRIPAVLAAYNAGPSRVARWREFPEWENQELFAERVPYSETRDYIRKVQLNRALYRMLYGGGATEAAPSGDSAR